MQKIFIKTILRQRIMKIDKENKQFLKSLYRWKKLTSYQKILWGIKLRQKNLAKDKDFYLAQEFYAN